jgi:hypothetical protein
MNPISTKQPAPSGPSLFSQIKTGFHSVLIRLLAPEIVRIAYSALLQRDPDQKGGMHAIQTLRTTGNVPIFLRSILNSEEFSVHAYKLAAPIVIAQIYQGLLGRPPDISGMHTCLSEFYKEGSVAGILNRMIDSAEFHKLKAKGILSSKHLAPLERLSADNYHAYELHQQNARVAQSHNPNWNNTFPARRSAPAVVFLHIAKTGGSSLHRMILDAYQHRCFSDHDNLLPFYLPAYMLQFDCYIGHFQYDTVSYLPKQNTQLATFLRAPHRRLTSIYNYYRAHAPGQPGFSVEMKRANEHSIDEFFQLPAVLNNPAYWNHMAWCVMGNTKWQEWKALHDADPQMFASSATIHTNIRKAIRERLQEFTFIGFFENYEESCRKFFAALDITLPPSIRHDHSLESNVGNDPRFHKHFTKQTLTGDSLKILDPLTHIDGILYEEARSLFS